MIELLESLSFDKYTYYIWVSYFLTFATICVLLYRTKSMHKKAITQLRIKYARDN